MSTSELDELERCHETLRRMEEEIAALRNASLTFGALADRLNQQVRNLRQQLRARDEAHAGAASTRGKRPRG